MTPKKAKELLNCSYTTLANYVKAGKISCRKNPLNNYSIYNDEEIYALSKAMRHSDVYSINLEINGKCVNSFLVPKDTFNNIFGELKDEKQNN